MPNHVNTTAPKTLDEMVGELREKRAELALGGG